MKVREISNGIIISNTDSTGTNQEQAFLFSDAEWKKKAKKYVSEQKIHIANQAESHAFKVIDRVAKKD